MTVTLPTSPGYAEATPMFIDAGATVPSPLGGATQRVNRLGGRWGLRVALPPMPHDAASMAWISALNRGLMEGVITRWPTVGFAIGTPGFPLVNAGGQTGTTLNIYNATAGYTFKAGQHISVPASGRLYNYEIRADTVVSGAFTAALPVFPELRASPDSVGTVDVTTPLIEGFLEEDGREWTIDNARLVGLSFTVLEAR